ncbi:MAG: hypothetical protein ACE15F_01680 [bacterium]
MKNQRIAQGMILLFALLWVGAASAQYVKGTREASKQFFRADEEMEFVLRLDNPGNSPKSVTVVEALPEGWTVVSTGQGGTAQTGGVFNPGLDQGLFSVFNAAPHEEDFNHVSQFWSNYLDGGYPYAGKSTVPRGDDEFETGAPEPLGVMDLQLHPPSNPHLTVAAFTAPVAGAYTISNLAVRRVYYSGESVTYMVFDSGKNLLASLQAFQDQMWITDDLSYPDGNLPAGDRIYFAVSNDGDYGWDATEIAFTVTTGNTVWHSYKAVTQDGFPQAMLPDESGTTPARLDFYESSNAGGVDLSGTSPITVNGPLITWTLSAAPGVTTLSYRAKAPSIPRGTAIWFGTCDGLTTRGVDRLGVISKAALVKGTRLSSQDYYRSNDEIDITIELNNPGGSSKPVAVTEAVPDGWTVVSTNPTGNVATGGVITPIDQGLLSTYSLDPHAEDFNHVREFWYSGTGYPYAGKSTVERGQDTNETVAPQPLGVFDLQLHPPNNEHLLVAAFVVPAAGTYSVSGLAARRVYNSGATVTFLLIDPKQNQVAALTASQDQAWVTDSQTYPLGSLNAGDRIYFAVYYDGEYGWDATEVAFDVTTGSTVWHSYDVVTSPGYPQATVIDEAGKTEARFDFYESLSDMGVDRSDASVTVAGSVISWTLTAGPGVTALNYKVKAPVSPTASAAWFGVSDGITVGGAQSLPRLLPAVGIFDGHADIGAVEAAGNAAFNSSTGEYEVTGSGADIWGTADEFHYVFKPVRGDFSLKAAIQLDPFESADPWVKAGLMIRDSLQPGAIFYDAILRADLQASSQWRPTADGGCQESGLLTLDFQDGRLEIERAGNTISAYYIDPATGQRVLFHSVALDLADPVYAGLAVTAHQDGSLSKGFFTGVELTGGTEVADWAVY